MAGPNGYKKTRQSTEAATGKTCSQDARLAIWKSAHGKCADGLPKTVRQVPTPHWQHCG